MRRILVVDDDLHVGRAIRLWLEQHGFRVSTADGGPNGLAALDNGPFDLMIVDVFMPLMRGFEAIRRFHERAPAVPLIAISGYAFAEEDAAAPEFLRLATRLGAMRCLPRDAAQCDRRMPLPGRTASQTGRNARRRGRGGDGIANETQIHQDRCNVVRG
jgi:CheY-like chemotaxis protein